MFCLIFSIDDRQNLLNPLSVRGGGGGVRKKTEILAGYKNLSIGMEKLLFINAATRRGMPL